MDDCPGGGLAPSDSSGRHTSAAVSGRHNHTLRHFGALMLSVLPYPSGAELPGFPTLRHAGSGIAAI